jgi:hypothetical protein
VKEGGRKERKREREEGRGGERRGEERRKEKRKKTSVLFVGGNQLTYVSNSGIHSVQKAQRPGPELSPSGSACAELRRGSWFRVLL